MYSQQQSKAEVEQIVAKKYINEIQYYQVQWKSYDSTYNSWVSVKNLSLCSDLIQKYEEDISEIIQVPLIYPPEKNPPHMLHKSKKIKKLHNNLQSGKQKTSTYKCFSKNDQVNIKKVLKCSKRGNQFCYEIEWEDKKNQKLHNSVITETQAKHHCPFKLIEFFESRYSVENLEVQQEIRNEQII